MSLVAFTKTTGLQFEKAISKSLQLIEYSFPHDAKYIIIKPNLCYYWHPSTGQTTDPRILESLIDVLRNEISEKIKISIVESDASAMKCRQAFRILGYEKLASRYNVTLINLSEEKYELSNMNAGKKSFNIKVPRIIRDADLRINVPKIKYSMEHIKLTCALKNTFGCNPNPKKYRYHKSIDEAIVAINKLMRFDLCVVDGNIVSGTQPRRLGLLMAGQDPVAVDAAASRIGGIRAKTVKYLTLAEREGLGSLHFVPRGVSPKYFSDRYPRKPAKFRIMERAYSLAVAFGLGDRLGLS